MEIQIKSEKVVLFVNIDVNTMFVRNNGLYVKFSKTQALNLSDGEVEPMHNLCEVQLVKRIEVEV